MTVRVLLADDQLLLRGMLRLLLDNTPGVEVVGEAADGAEAVALAREYRPDVVLMDIRMPGADGLEATRLITADSDLAAVRVLVLTTFELDEYVVEAIQAGAAGFIGKGTAPEELLKAIEAVAAGEALLSAAATRTLMAYFQRPGVPQLKRKAESLTALTPRERDVLMLVAGGLSNDEISERLHLSTHTVKTHINRSMTKLGVSDRAHLVVIAYESGLVHPTIGP